MNGAPPANGKRRGRKCVFGSRKEGGRAALAPHSAERRAARDYEHTEDESFPPLPPPLSLGVEDEAEHFINGVEDSDGNRDSSAAEENPLTVRKSVKRPRPKLDAQRLVSERGLPALRHMFDKIKFRGKGHEAEDLKTLIRHMEHWAHRLFPKLQFDDFVDRLETLGNKKEVQTCLKRIRLDVPIIHEDFMTDQGANIGLDEASDDLELFSESVQQNPPSPPLSGVFLSEEQKQRMERNRQLAMQRRQAKTQSSTQAQADDMESFPLADTSVNETQDLEDQNVLVSVESASLVTHHTTVEIETGTSTTTVMDHNKQLEIVEEI
uniref:TIMELESS-interacting protein n=1 Tax=Geotrypetes seraphini TaxID=260995 RepID=A0A6P8P3B2_GEOSA|nr:TIMELESS-interacting protein isoform X2 [Geotrypetes seraphini]